MGLFHDENIFNEVLEKLDFSISNDISNEENPKPEIVFVDNPPENLHPKHYIALEFAKEFGATAVYFRYYEDNRYCVPQVYFYNNFKGDYDKNKIAEIHRNVYSSCQVPLICFVGDVSISMYDCRIPVEETKNGISNQKAKFKDDTFFEDIDFLKSYFSAEKLNFGIFWESDAASNHFLNNKSAYEKLVSVLSEIRNKIVKEFRKLKLPKSFAEDLLLKCILVKYLEESGKKNNEDNAKKFYQGKNLNHGSISEFIINGELTQLLDVLEYHFNGGVFQISYEERRLIENTDLSILSSFLDGKLDENQQGSIWEKYSFKYIPIELISNFYEEFIDNKEDDNKGTVYTPSFLVNLLIDECLPISSTETNYKVKLIDASCGSGIFISSAFKRLVQRWRVAKGKNGKLLEEEQIRIQDVKEILTRYIYGVDKNETAVKLTKFSLQLAFCQIVPNDKLWKWTDDGVFEKVFDDLNNNIVENDFFDFLCNRKELHNSFDLVIGNPPFKKIDVEEITEIEDKLIKSEININFSSNSKRQLALIFLQGIMHLTRKETGKICQIIPSGELLYFEDSKKFRTDFFNKYNVSQLLDFTLLRRNLFVSKKNDTTVPVSVIFAENKETDENPILHVVVRRTRKSKEKIYFEIEYYDFYEVSKEQAQNEIKIWQANIFGGLRVLDFFNKNNKSTKLKDYLFDKKISTAKRGNLKNNLCLWKSVSESRFPFFLENKDITSESINFANNDITVLKKFKSDLESNPESKNAFIAIHSSRLFYRPYNIEHSDIYNVPMFFENNSYSDGIIASDIAAYKIKEIGSGELAPINSKISEYKFLYEYADIFNQSFNSIYKKDGKEQYLKKIIEGDDFFALEFFYGDKLQKTKEIKSKEEIESILKNQKSRNAVINRIMKIYGEDSITFMKPKNLRYWLKSIALRDADDVFDDMIQNGY